ncbi:hypothetical protein CN692_10805 [Bacillus sp. AFS002410]|uniref:RipA family octameric membrane protein n=1 Tax=Bacillus sp. AFS002410 TaxID=2033481 RepID=UPI000BEF3B90|nr:hypothetical protein [Bacillus sp. AFS002410]PEJ57974.1 hypothetical protein CN692_10805 [Bacillus sp. AFS002410]
MTQQSNEENQFNLLAANRDNYGNSYDNHFFEQYKLYVEMADRISFLGVNTTLITVLTTLAPKFKMAAIWITPPFIAVLLFCFVWWRIVKSYRQLNSGKYKIIGEIENYLPLKPYAAEWKALGEGSNPKLYQPLTHVENWIPILFALLYTILLVIFLGVKCFN